MINGKRVMRIELTYQAWEARVLPLNYTRIFVTGDGGKPGSKVKALSAQIHFYG